MKREGQHVPACSRNPNQGDRTRIRRMSNEARVLQPATQVSCPKCHAMHAGNMNATPQQRMPENQLAFLPVCSLEKAVQVIGRGSGRNNENAAPCPPSPPLVLFFPYAASSRRSFFFFLSSFPVYAHALCLLGEWCPCVSQTEYQFKCLKLSQTYRRWQ